LTSVAQVSTDRFVANRRRDPGFEFEWPQLRGESVRDAVVRTLSAQCDGHCCYCDSFPVDATGRVEVDHFKPKALHPEEVLAWENLYLACTACNVAKLAEWNADLLRSDEPVFSFERYFVVDAFTGRLLPRPDASESDRRRAAETIRVLGLQRDGLNIARWRAIKNPDASPRHLRQFRFLSGA
jgi:uncharacterized protein (TIGR02646 family)